MIFLNVCTTVDEAHILFRDKYGYFNIKERTSKDKTGATFFRKFGSQS